MLDFFKETRLKEYDRRHLVSFLKPKIYYYFIYLNLQRNTVLYIQLIELGNNKSFSFIFIQNQMGWSACSLDLKYRNF